MKRFLFLVLLFGLSIYVCAQSTDNVKIYVLYDVSGSTNYADKEQNSFKLLKELLNVKDDKVESKLAYNLFSFGEKVGETKSELDIMSVEIEKNREKELANLNKLTNTGLRERYTHLLSGLDSVVSIAGKSNLPDSDESKNKNKNKETYGIFIFTDGLIKDGDVDIDEDYKQYIEQIKNRIVNLRKAGIPVFIVQCSPNHHNDFHDLGEHVSKDHLKISKDFFWLSSTLKYNRDRDSSITQGFHAFIVQALSQILTYASIPLQEDYLGRLIYLAEILELAPEKPKNSKKAGKSDGSEGKSAYDNFIKRLKNVEADTNISNNKAHLNTDPNSVALYASLDSKGIYLPRGLKINSNPPETMEQIAKRLEKIQKLLSAINNSTVFNRDDILELDSLIEKVIISEKYDELILQFKKFIRDSLKTSNIKIDPSPSLVAPSLQAAEEVVPVEEPKKAQTMEQAIILGLTDYLIERVQKEAIFIFYEHLYEDVIQKNSFIRDTLFFHTSNTLDPLGNSDVFDPNITLITEAFTLDFQQLPENITKHPDIRGSDGLLALAYATTLTHDLLKGNSLQESFGLLASHFKDSLEGTTTLERSFIFTAHFIDFLQQHNLADAYTQLDERDLDILSEMAVVWIAAKYGDIVHIRKMEDLAAKFKKLYQDYELVRTSVKALQEELTSIEPNSDFDDYREYRRDLLMRMLNRSAELLVSGVDLAEHFCDDNELSQIKTDIFKYRLICQSSIDVWFKVQDGEYIEAAAVVLPMISELAFAQTPKFEELKTKPKRFKATADIESIQTDLKIFTDNKQEILIAIHDHRNKPDNYNDSAAIALLVEHNIVFLKPYLYPLLANNSASAVTVTEIETKLEEIEAALTSIEKIFNNNDYDPNRKIKETLEVIEDDEISQEVVLPYIASHELAEELKNLISLSGEISIARTAGDVKNVLNKYALPVASYRAKKKPGHTIMVNSYVGLGGTLYLNNESSNNTQDGSLIINAPVGFELSFGIAPPKHSFSVFVPIIDVGNVIDYRLWNSDEESIDEDIVNLESIFSPGVYGVWGFSKKFPFSLGLGYQTFPNRLSLFLAFDLPLLRLN